MQQPFRSIRWLLGATLAALLVVGCASSPTGTPEEIVAARAKARWDALIAKRWGDAYQFLTPSQRALVEENRYASRFGDTVQWLSAEVVNVKCTDLDNCSARIKITFRALIAGRNSAPNNTAYDEIWIREDGRWWFYEKL